PARARARDNRARDRAGRLRREVLAPPVRAVPDAHVAPTRCAHRPAARDADAQRATRKGRVQRAVAEHQDALGGRLAARRKRGAGRRLVEWYAEAPLALAAVRQVLVPQVQLGPPSDEVLAEVLE